MEPEDSEEREEVGGETDNTEDIVIGVDVLDVLLMGLELEFDVLDEMLLLAVSSFLFFRASVLVACLFRCSR